jgi:MtaA/CmuA family methyltransferase
MQFAAEYIGSTYADFAADYKILTRANVICAHEFGIDQLSCISDPYRETQGFGGKITYVTDGPPRSTHPLENEKDLSVLEKPHSRHSERMADRLKAIELYREEFAEKYSVLGWVEGPAAEAADLRNVMNFLIDLIGDEVFAGDLMDLCVDAAIAFACAQIEAGADTIGIGDAIASQVSPDMYERLIQPREKKLVRTIKEYGAHVKLHICGNLTHLLPGISDLGVDILDVDHMVDMRLVRRTMGDKVILTGNLDPVSVVKNGTPDLIRNALHKIYKEVGNPYMINAGCEIPSGTPVENLRALCEEIPFIR